MPFRVECNIHIHSLRRSPFPRPSRQQEGGESPSAVRVAGQKTIGRQPFGERRGAAGRVKAKPFGCHTGSLDPPVCPKATKNLEPLLSTRNDEGPLVAGAIKWAMDKPARKDEEVRDKRLALEHALKERLSEMRSSYFGQLDRTGQEFLGTARILARPVLLEAQAGHELATLEKRVGEVVLRRSRQSVGNLLNQLQM